MSLAWEEQQKPISTWKENLSQSYEWICQLRTISFVVSILYSMVLQGRVVESPMKLTQG